MGVEPQAVSPPTGRSTISPRGADASGRTGARRTYAADSSAAAEGKRKRPASHQETGRIRRLVASRDWGHPKRRRRRSGGAARRPTYPTIGWIEKRPASEGGAPRFFATIDNFQHNKPTPIVKLSEGNGLVTTGWATARQGALGGGGLVSRGTRPAGGQRAPLYRIPFVHKRAIPPGGTVTPEAAGARSQISPIGQLGVRSRPGWPPPVASPLR